DVLPTAKDWRKFLKMSCQSQALPDAVIILGHFMHDYSKVVAAICQDTCGDTKNDDVCAFEEHL
ncbi:hypothetical protein MKW92_015850, partial [Papaver armeniacum]